MSDPSPRSADGQGIWSAIRDLLKLKPSHSLRESIEDAIEEHRGDADNPDPRLHVRGAVGNGLEARIDRALYYEIDELALAEASDPPAIWSNGARFPLVDA